MPLAGRTLVETTAETLAGHDVVFLALPHGQSAGIAEQLGEDVTVIDCGADFRLTEAEAWVEFYGGEHAGSWPYGLPELPGQREKLRGSNRVAVPGCYPTVSTLALLPAVQNGLVDPGQLVVVAVSGTSGAGKAPKPHLLGAEVMGSASAYGVGGVHRHTPEIEQNLTPYADAAGERLVHPGARADVARHPRHLQRTGCRRHRPRRRCGRPTRMPTATSRSCTCCPRDSGRRRRPPSARTPCSCRSPWTSAPAAPSIVAAMDNLTKGTAGAAVQCMNLAAGLDETLALPLVGVAP